MVTVRNTGRRTDLLRLSISDRRPGLDGTTDERARAVPAVRRRQSLCASRVPPSAARPAHAHVHRGVRERSVEEESTVTSGADSSAVTIRT